MVAYSFKARFAPAIISGTKRQTVRADRKRHARKGEMLQLFTGMRTKHCKKITHDRTCVDVEKISILVGPASILGITLVNARGTRRTLNKRDTQLFAKCDGFADLADMHAFWLAEHGEGLFEGVLINW